MNIKKGGLRALPALLLGALFLILAIGLALLSGNVYRRIVQSADQTAMRRTALSYLVGQVRRSDTADGISRGSFGESDAVFLWEDGYVTVLYQHEGQLRELYMEEGSALSPEDGMAIVPMDRLAITAEGGLLTFSVTDPSGAVHEARVLPRCGLREEPA